MRASPLYPKNIDCPLKKIDCELICPYLKPSKTREYPEMGYTFTDMRCDYPYIGKVKAEPDKAVK